jgi:TolA-binding protein
MKYNGKAAIAVDFCFKPSLLANTLLIVCKLYQKNILKASSGILIRIALIVPLFLFNSILGYSQYETIPAPIQSAYFELLSLKLDQGNTSLERESIQHKNNPYFLLVNSYATTLYILLYEDQNFYQKNKNQYSQSIKILSKQKHDEYWKKLIEAEIRFQAGLVKMRFNEEVAASWEFKQSYQIIQKLHQANPSLIPHKKLMGLFQIFLGSVPEKYNWITRLFRIQGSIEHGQKYLEEVSQSNSIFSLEATMLKAAADKFMLKNPLCVSCKLESTLNKQRDNYLLAYLYASILVKEGNSDAAFQTLARFSQHQYIHFPLAYLLQGETMLYKGEYEKAQYYFLNFLKYTQGENHVKDAYYKLFLTYWLTGDDKKAEMYLAKVLNSGQNTYDADKYAYKFALSKELPDENLMKARLNTDGGYLDKALEELRKYCFQKPEDSKDNIEFWYRKGRINQLKGQYKDAYFYYKKTITLSEGKKHYFAPNACLQLGYLYRDDNNIAEAKYYFIKAISYQDHEYKNSIDNKAKAALSELK